MKAARVSEIFRRKRKKNRIDPQVKLLPDGVLYDLCSKLLSTEMAFQRAGKMWMRREIQMSEILDAYTGVLLSYYGSIASQSALMRAVNIEVVSLLAKDNSDCR